MDYDDIRTQVTGFLNRRDLTSTQRDTLITSGFDRIHRELRCPLLESTTNYTIPNTYWSDGGIIIPPDYIELIDLIPQASGQVRRLEKSDITRVLRLANESGVVSDLDIGAPTIYCRQGQRWLLGPAPTTGDVIRINYYGKSTTLVSGSDTNALTISAPSLVWYAALSYVGDFFADKRVATWEQRYVQIKDELNAASQAEDETGGAAVMPAYDYPNELGDSYLDQWF